MKIAVVVPCYKVKKHILGVLESIDSTVSKIYVVDDACPDGSGKYVVDNCMDNRVSVLFSEVNSGVGGAVISGYLQALKDDMDIVVKVDGDGQMDCKLIPKFCRPILEGKADYTKGNRFNSIDSLVSMPLVRKIGNALLSFVNKASSGYWKIMDPTNGFTAIHKTALSLLPLDKLSNRYFFESDMLFRLGTIRAVVRDISMDSKYGDEKSNLKISKVIFEFTPLYIRSFFKRIFYTYFLRDFHIASIELVLGCLLMLFGVVFGSYEWLESSRTGIPASTGTVMVAILPVIIGFQLLLSSMHYDLANSPSIPLQGEE